MNKLNKCKCGKTSSNDSKEINIKENKLLKICSFLFCIAFFVFFGRLIYQEYFDNNLEYENTTGTVIEISETTDTTSFKTGKIIYTATSTWYVVMVKLEDGEVVEFPTQDKDKYSCGDIVSIRKVYQIKNDKRKLVNYNLLNG